MAAGLRINNAAGSVAISNSSYGVAYIGQATFTGAAQPLGFTQGNNPIAGSGHQFYIYQIASSYMPIVFMQLTTDRYIVTAIVNVGGNTWNITVGGSGNWSPPPILKCFARLVGQGASGVVGLKVRDPATGLRTWDTYEKMLILRRRFDWAAYQSSVSEATVQSQGLTGIAAPYLLAEQGIYLTTQSWYVDGNQQMITAYGVGWSYFNGQISRLARGITMYQYRDDTRPSNTNLLAERCYIIEGNEYN